MWTSTYDYVVYLYNVSSALVVLCSHQILYLQKLFFCVETFSLCYLSAKFHHSHSIEKKLCDNIFIYAMKYVSGGCAEQQSSNLWGSVLNIHIWLRETKHQSPWLSSGAAGDQTIISPGSLFVSSSGPRPVGGTLASPLSSYFKTVHRIFNVWKLISSNCFKVSMLN